VEIRKNGRGTKKAVRENQIKNIVGRGGEKKFSGVALKKLNHRKVNSAVHKYVMEAKSEKGRGVLCESAVGVRLLYGSPTRGGGTKYWGEGKNRIGSGLLARRLTKNPTGHKRRRPSGLHGSRYWDKSSGQTS